MKFQTRATLEQKMLPMENEQFRTTKEAWPFLVIRWYLWMHKGCEEDGERRFQKSDKTVMKRYQILDEITEGISLKQALDSLI